MFAAVGLDPASMTYAISFGIGRIAAVTAVTVAVYVLASAAITLMSTGGNGQRRDDIAGLVLIAALAMYLVFSRRLDGTWFAIVSAGLLGVSALALLLAEAQRLVARMRAGDGAFGFVAPEVIRQGATAPGGRPARAPRSDSPCSPA